MIENSDEIEKKVKKQRRKLKRREVLLVSIIITISAVSVFLIIKNYYRKINNIRFDEYELYQYFSGKKFLYDGVISITYKEEATEVKSKNKNIDPGTIPIYFEKITNEALFPTNMELVFPKYKNKNFRLKYFTRIINDLTSDGESAFIKNKKNNIFIESSFLYDGENLYFFPYTTKVEIDHKEYNLSPLSYIIVNYKGTIEMYDKLKDLYIIIDEHNNDVVADVGNFKVNLSTDMIMYADENRLLVKNVSKLPLYDGK
ncbi:MAG: hypothetical protein IKF82_06880 [Bacilli bacterium]|nr:hypothetical protein [Bacilli bacterium]